MLWGQWGVVVLFCVAFLCASAAVTLYPQDQHLPSELQARVPRSPQASCVSRTIEEATRARSCCPSQG